MKKTTATQKKSKEVDTATEMTEQQKTRGTKSGAKRKAKKQDLPKHQKTKKPRTTPEKSLITNLEYLQTRMEKDIQRIAPAITSRTEEKVIPRFEREEERVHERIDENVQAELSDESLKKVTSVLRKMADTVVEFAEVMAEIGNTRTGGGIIKRTFENIAEMINGVSSSQPPQQQGMLDDDDIFNQPSFLDAVSALEQAFLQTRKNYAAQPEQPITSQSQHHIQTPSFDLGVPSPQPAAMEQPQNKIDSTELRNIARDLDEDSEKTISDEQQLDTTPEDNTMKELFDSLIAEPNDDDHTEQVVAETSRRFKILPMNLRSPFWTKNDEMLKKVGPKEKLISDYAFLDPTEERPLTEQLFEYAGYYLNRETFQSMRVGELESVIVDVWCLRLNQLDLNRVLDKPKRIIFSTQAFLQLDSPTNWERGENTEQSSYQTDFEQCLDTEINNVGKLDISDAQLIFFGIYRHNHFYILCYNFTTSMLEIIDNRPLPKGMRIQQKYADSPKVLNTAFSEYLMKRGHTSLAEKIPKLPVELVKMNWRTADNKTDCGLYCMRHMETYMGNPQWKCGFTPKNPNDPYLASLRALYTSRILMMPVNVHKATVIRNAEEHFIGKRLLQ
nr:uncharacterized protein LOC109153584 [Ipomoea batatas]